MTTKTEPDKGLVFDIQRFSIHDGPGIRTSVFFKGCPLRCAWCSNPESQSRLPEPMWSRRDERTITVGQWMTVDQVMAVVMRDHDYYEHSGGGMTLSGGEFMLQPRFAIALIDAAHRAGLTVAGETCGAVRPATFASIVDKMDLVLMDLKQADPATHTEMTGGQLRLVLDNAEYLARSGVDHVFRIPVIPGVNDSQADAEAFARLLDELGGTHRVELILFHQLGRGKYADLGRPYAFSKVPSLTQEQAKTYQAHLERCGVIATLV